MIFTPAAPSAGPTGGEGLAAPPLIFTLIIFAIFFAMIKQYADICGSRYQIKQLLRNNYISLSKKRLRF